MLVSYYVKLCKLNTLIPGYNLTVILVRMLFPFLITGCSQSIHYFKMRKTHAHCNHQQMENQNEHAKTIKWDLILPILTKWNQLATVV